MGQNELGQRSCRDGGGAWERNETSVCSGGGRSGLKKIKDPVSGAQVPCVQRQRRDAQDPGQLLVFCLGGIFRQDQKF